MDPIITILSLVVAGLAVVITPVVSWKVANRQLLSSLKIASEQIIAPMRQAWINSLRELLAEFSGSALHYFLAGFEGRSDSEYRQMFILEAKVQLMLNPKEDDHIQLEKLIRKLMTAVKTGNEVEGYFIKTQEEIIELSRRVLKREWAVVKGIQKQIPSAPGQTTTVLNSGNT